MNGSLFERSKSIICPGGKVVPKSSATRGIKEYLKIIGPGTVITILGFFIAYQFVEPAPPRQIAIATGSPDGAYFEFGEVYSEIMQQYGITLEVISTAGSAENLQLLDRDKGGVDVAFLQGGIKPSGQSNDIISLGSLYYEPLWIFHAAELETTQLSQLKGMRISVGQEGSGTKVLAMILLAINDVTEQNTTLLSLNGENAANKLMRGEIDAAFFVTAHQSPVIQPLLKSTKYRLMSMSRAEAYAAHFHYLSVLNLPEGAIDFVNNIPNRNTKMLATTTHLVARADIHPALIDLLLLIATQVHQAGDLFEKKGEFPTPKYVDFKMSKEAERYYKTGPPFLRRYLPFWLATFIDRTKIMLVPLIALFFPFFKVMPLIYRWRFRSKIYRWYKKLAEVDPQLLKDDMTSHRDEYLSRLNHIETQVSQTSVPLPFSNELYHLRLHIEMLRNKLVQAEKETKIADDL
jgi:TRAP transporter TAXI family solute receptor